MTNTTITKNPTLKNAYEYVERWRNRGHDAFWIANEVWNKVHWSHYERESNRCVNEPWQGWAVEDYRLNEQEAVFYQARIDALEIAKKESAEREEKRRLADEAHNKAVNEYLQYVRDHNLTKVMVKATISLRLCGVAEFDRDDVKYFGTKWQDEQIEKLGDSLSDMFQDVDFDGDDAIVEYTKIYEVDFIDSDDSYIDDQSLYDKMKGEVLDFFFDEDRKTDIELHEDDVVFPDEDDVADSINWDFVLP